MKKNEKVSAKNFIPIREYCDNYLDLPFTWNGKLTHKRLVEYAFEKGKKLPRRGIFQEIKKEEILNGSYYLIKDEVGKIIPYQAQRLSFDSILADLNRVNKDVLARRRESILREQGYVATNTGSIVRKGITDPDAYEEETIESLGSVLVNNNRVKRLVNRRINH